MSNSLSEIYVFVVAGMLLFTVFCVFIVFFVTSYYRKQQQNQKEKQRLQNQFNEDLLNSTIEIQEKAFDDISRELHDNVGQQLSAASIYLNLLIQEQKEHDGGKLESCRDIIGSSLQDIRQISQTLLGEKISKVGLVASIQLEITRINKLGLCVAALEAGDLHFALDPRKEVILFRIVQEAISNATKHAPGCELLVSIKQLGDRLDISIRDNGKGFDAEQLTNPGIGLLNMQSRAQTIGAIFSIQSQTNEGTEIKISLDGKETTVAETP
ncbi:sensor histidine kinase [Niabella insulamsoli]|uniref:sensor histidine kinase n=1 Tax=Niabella insulamsoli TaxID=3144874 RepID=UPI0031FDABB3